MRRRLRSPLAVTEGGRGMSCFGAARNGEASRGGSGVLRDGLERQGGHVAVWSGEARLVLAVLARNGPAPSGMVWRGGLGGVRSGMAAFGMFRPGEAVKRKGESNGLHQS